MTYREKILQICDESEDKNRFKVENYLSQKLIDELSSKDRGFYTSFNNFMMSCIIAKKEIDLDCEIS